LDQLRQLVSQDRNQNKNKNSHSPPRSPKKKQDSSTNRAVPRLHVQSPDRRSFDQGDDGMQRVDSARTFVRKYQKSYNADRPPANSLREARMTKDAANNNDNLEKSLQSNSFLHKPEQMMGNELPSDFHALMELDKTLKSESRFVYPDGRAFVPGANDSRPGSSDPRPQLNYHLQPYENAATIPVKIPLPAPPLSPSTRHRKYELRIDETLNLNQMDVMSPSRSVSTLGPDSPAGSAVTLASERSRRKNSSHSNSRKHDVSGDGDDDLEFDVDRAFRRNRRKWELLEKMGLRTEASLDGEGGDMNVFSGPEELDMLLNGLHSVSSSRPTTADTNRPGTAGTLQGESQLIGHVEYDNLLQKERDKHKQNQMQQGYRRRQQQHKVRSLMFLCLVM
jgi:hypothetical protein